jgi:hypothetical protein
MALVDLQVTKQDLERLRVRALADYGRSDEAALSQVVEAALQWRLESLERGATLTTKLIANEERRILYERLWDYLFREEDTDG